MGAVFLVERAVLRVISATFAVLELIDVSREWGPEAVYMGSRIIRIRPENEGYAEAECHDSPLPVETRKHSHRVAGETNGDEGKVLGLKR